MMRPSVVALLALALVTAPSITPAVAAPADGPSYVIGVSGMT